MGYTSYKYTLLVCLRVLQPIKLVLLWNYLFGPAQHSMWFYFLIT